MAIVVKNFFPSEKQWTDKTDTLYKINRILCFLCESVKTTWLSYRWILNVLFRIFNY